MAKVWGLKSKPHSVSLRNHKMSIRNKIRRWLIDWVKKKRLNLPEHSLCKCLPTNQSFQHFPIVFHVIASLLEYLNPFLWVALTFCRIKYLGGSYSSVYSWGLMRITIVGNGKLRCCCHSPSILLLFSVLPPRLCFSCVPVWGFRYLFDYTFLTATRASLIITKYQLFSFRSAEKVTQITPTQQTSCFNAYFYFVWHGFSPWPCLLVVTPQPVAIFLRISTGNLALVWAPVSIAKCINDSCLENNKLNNPSDERRKCNTLIFKVFGTFM